MTSVLVTGAAGFIGKHCVRELARRAICVEAWTKDEGLSALSDKVAAVGAIIHLAGVNRPTSDDEFERVNVQLTRSLCELAMANGRPAIVFASSRHAQLQTPYGISKKKAEDNLRAYAKAGGRAAIFRLPNVFGPGARPNYNSAVATFAHNSALGLSLFLHDTTSAVSLVYVHDVVDALIDAATSPPADGAIESREVNPVVDTSVGELADFMQSFARSREDLRLPNFTDAFVRQLYATFLSYLPVDRLAYDLPRHNDPRGTLAETLKSPSIGQIFVSRTAPGITRGNHFHHTKTEKFVVLQGEAVIRFRPAYEPDGSVSEYRVSGTDFRVVDIPPGLTHSIENVGVGELVVLFWASEVFDPNHPDTFPLNVI